ncbi:hypothetical protein Taro_050684 [Colocasia esculenta]|uniref:Uncharacterized protein n=1 Tax=Colocasia esculenta TaxID=4460 RepID=A0A843XE25_COLES|nr:hypothetical protein [Colocasia esculenta]
MYLLPRGTTMEPQPQLCQHQGTPQQWQSTSRKGMTPSHENGLLVHDASIQPGQHNTRTTSQSHSHERKVQLPLHNHKPKNIGDQPTPHLQTTQLQAQAWHL